MKNDQEEIEINGVYATKPSSVREGLRISLNPIVREDTFGDIGSIPYDEPPPQQQQALKQLYFYRALFAEGGLRRSSPCCCCRRALRFFRGWFRRFQRYTA